MGYRRPDGAPRIEFFAVTTRLGRQTVAPHGLTFMRISNTIYAYMLGVIAMSNTKRLSDLLAQNRGLLRTADAEALGISRPSVMEFVRTRGMQRLAHGVYTVPGAWVDDMHLLSLRSNRAVFSHESALLLHGLAEREPEELTVTLPSGYNASLLRRDGIRVHFIKPELMTLGRIELPTPDGNLVATYDLERTICDVVRHRSRIDQQTLSSALRAYARRPDKRMDTLADYASMLGVERPVRSYLEILL